MTTDRTGNVVRYGRINKEMVVRWMKLEPADDGPFWALNLMKYRGQAEYTDGRDASISGREADDAYSPLESLAGVGAEPVFLAEVERMLVGDGVEWDRVAIVKYPSRRAFFEMQQRDDFKRQHQHKDAGMEFTIVMSCLPDPSFIGAERRFPFIEMSVQSDGDAGAKDSRMAIEGVIVGDERVWHHVDIRWLDDAAEITPRGSSPPSPDAYVMLLKPVMDRLTRSITTV